MSSLAEKYIAAKTWLKKHPGCQESTGSFNVSYRELPDGTVEVTCTKCGNKIIIN